MSNVKLYLNYILFFIKTISFVVVMTKLMVCNVNVKVVFFDFKNGYKLQHRT